MDTLHVDSGVSERLQTFLNSELFSVRSRVAKSDYWKENSNQLQTHIAGNSIEVQGKSGFYVPRKASILHRTARKIQRALQEPSEATRWLKRQVVSPFETPRSMSYEQAFDAVMGHAEIADPDLSPYRINHLKLALQPKVFATMAAMKRHYQDWSGYAATPQIINAYYYQNILRGFVGQDQIHTVLEIGAGNGNFPSVLYHDWAPVRVILLDLPETLAVAIPFLSSLFPQAKMALPHEIQALGRLPEKFDFAFLTVDQLHILTDDSIDLALNFHSFQEMTREQIADYFQLVLRVCHEGGWFFTANRVEKIPCGSDSYTVEQLSPPNRFAEYPWHCQNEVLVHEISRLTRLVQLDSIAIRLERIHKR